MTIKAFGFEFDTKHGLYLRIAFLGAAHRHPRLGWTFDTWAEIRRVERRRLATP